jgi:serine protease Do
LVGINTAIYAPTGVFSGIGFAIPVNDAKQVMKDLIEKGYVERSWLGVEIAEVDDVVAQQFGLGKAAGALINNVIPDSPAQKAGLQRGDVIVEVNGKKVKNVVEVQELISRTPPKTTITLKIIRENLPKVVKVTTQLMPREGKGEEENENEPKEEPKSETKDWLGATFAPINSITREQYEIPQNVTKGVVIVDVGGNGVAAEAGLQEGDVIRSINRIKTDNLSDLVSLSKKVHPKKGLVFDVLRQGHSFYLSYKSL